MSYWNNGNPNGMICDEKLWQPPSNCRVIPSLQALDETLTIKFTPLYFGDVAPSLDWCTENNGFWNEDNSTCYFENKNDFDNGMIAIDNMMSKISDN